MKKTPFYLIDSLMSVYKFSLLFAFMLGLTSIIAGIGYGIYAYSVADLSFGSSMYSGFILFLKGAGIAGSISFLSFLAFWKKHQIAFEECQRTPGKNCDKIGFFSLA